MTRSQFNDIFEKAKVLGNIGMFLMSIIFALVSYMWSSSKSDVEEIKQDVKTLLHNDATTAKSINELERRMNTVEDRQFKLSSNVSK